MAALTDKQIEKLIAAGGNRWTKYGNDRIYIDADAIGLEVECYRSGNVRSASWKGEPISNSDASRIMMGRAYVDVSTGEVVTKCTFNPRAGVMGYDEAVQRFVDAALADDDAQGAGDDAGDAQVPQETQDAREQDAAEPAGDTQVPEGAEFVWSDYAGDDYEALYRWRGTGCFLLMRVSGGRTGRRDVGGVTEPLTYLDAVAWAREHMGDEARDAAFGDGWEDD